MSVDRNKQLVRRYYEEVVSTGNVDNIADFISPDYVEFYNNQRHEVVHRFLRIRLFALTPDEFLSYPDLR